MSAKRSLDNIRKNLRTWVEIDSRAARKNYDTFRKLVRTKGGAKEPELWAVVKSNAYGHGLFAFSKLMEQFGIDGFCVDSVVEGIALRKGGIKKPVLVLGQTLPSHFKEATRKNITITISNFDALTALARGRKNSIPRFHIKIDSGMHRQGFYPHELPRVMRFMNASTSPIKSRLKGVGTHFASAKDINYPTYTDKQFAAFEGAVKVFEKNGFKNLIKHVAATGGTLIDKKYHCDAVRVGIGLYGLWPSKELEIQRGGTITLHPVLSWKTEVSEVKPIAQGDYIGYDLTERAPKDMMMAVLPIGYWHGFPRALSSIGEVIIRGEKAKVLGRVSMDIIVVGLPKSTKVRPDDIATLIGRDGREALSAADISQKMGASHYEFITRLNPLMERVII